MSIVFYVYMVLLPPVIRTLIVEWTWYKEYTSVPEERLQCPTPA